MEATESRSPRLYIPLGRGSRGKTFLTRWMVERARNGGRDVVVADIDRTNASLSSYFNDAGRPLSADDRDVEAFFSGLIESQIASNSSVVADFGGGDLIIKRLAREIDLTNFLASNGIEAVAIHLIGPDPDDLAYLESVEDGMVFAPPATILVLNEALCPPHRTPHAAFQETINMHDIFKRTLGRGAQLVRMPRLQPSDEINALRLTFQEAEHGQTSLGPWKRQQVSLWRRDMELAFAKISTWLP